MSKSLKIASSCQSNSPSSSFTSVRVLSIVSNTKLPSIHCHSPIVTLKNPPTLYLLFCSREFWMSGKIYLEIYTRYWLFNDSLKKIDENLSDMASVLDFGVEEKNSLSSFWFLSKKRPSKNTSYQTIVWAYIITQLISDFFLITPTNLGK